MKLDGDRELNETEIGFYTVRFRTFGDAQLWENYNVQQEASETLWGKGVVALMRNELVKRGWL